MEKRKRTILIILVSLIMVFLILIYLILIQISPPKPLKTRCGDRVCEKLENRFNCPKDCGIQHTECGDGICEMPETEINCLEDCKLVSWQEDYERMRINAGISNKYLEKTTHFDYDARNIMDLVYDIRANTNSAEEAVKKTAREVYLEIDYFGVKNPAYKPLGAGTDCKSIQASEILAREYGLCSTMSKVNIAILRGMGIAARPVVGCASIVGSCQLLKILPGVDLPKINPIRIEDGEAVIGGGLHAWVEVWLPEEGWVLLESTNGIVYKDPKCIKYNTLMHPTTISNLCTSSDWDYVNSCRDESLFK